MPSLSSSTSKHRQPANLVVKKAKPAQAMWLYSGLVALAKDAGTYGLMALGQLCEHLHAQQAALTCYNWGSQFNPMFYQYLGDAYMDTHADRALGYYQQALQTTSDGSPDVDTQTVHAKQAFPSINLLKKLAKAHSKQQQWAEAAVCLTTVFEQQPDDFETIYHLAEVSVIQGEWFKSMYYCKEGLNHDPRNGVLWGHLGFAMYRLNDTEGSIKAYQTALQFGQENQWKSQVAQTLGQLTYQQNGPVDHALDYFKQAMQLNPHNVDAIEMLAETALKQNHLQEALSAYSQLLGLTNERSDIYCALGYVLWQLDRNDEAIDAYLGAIHLDSKNAIALNNLGVIYLDEQLLPGKALTLFQEAFRLNPHYTLARFNEGRCYDILGKTKMAAEAFSEALTLNEISPEMDSLEIQERLNHLFALGTSDPS
jgi:tetratricopeptide (TPR) repeat protein